MFKIDCFVEDKNLPNIMRALVGLAIDLKVVPVLNAVPAKGKGQPTLVEQHPGGTVGYLAGELRKEQSFTQTDVAALLVQAGRSQGSAYYYCEFMVKRGLARRINRKIKGRRLSPIYTMRPLPGQKALPSPATEPQTAPQPQPVRVR